MANIKVAVRVRPISARELKLTGSEVVVRTGSNEANEISLTNLKVSSSKAGDSRERIRRYGFDYCFDSSDPEAKNYATQATIYETLGQSILDAMFSGYNSCLVAYGQSASGKTYTMMGTKEDPGLIPRLCEGLFSRVEQGDGHERIYRVTVSYLEIYNERVRDLLKPTTSASGLRIREHPRLGPYVQGLTHHVVRTLGSLMSYVEEGARARKTASTLQNPSSSRSHALLTVTLSQEATNAESSGDGNAFSRRQVVTPRGGSRLHLVDLAGSESAATCGGVHRLKEGANINKSLVALGNVISALVERGSTGNGPSRRYIPYRDSSLTWLLKDALGGNATTIMLATISPASGSYNETAHTLRFAQRAQSVVNRPVVNEDPVARLIRELRDEVARLKSLLLEKDIDQEAKVPCCCAKSQSSKDSAINSQYREDQESLNISRLEESDPKDDSVRAKDERCLDVLPIRRYNSNDSVTTYETGSTGSIRKFNSYEQLQSADRFVGNYNQAKVTELNDEEDELVEEINEPVFVDIPTLVAVLIKPDDSLQESSTQIEEICSDEVQEDSIDTDFIDGGNERFEGTEKIDDIDLDDRSDSVNFCNVLGNSEISEFHQTPSQCLPLNPASVERSRPRGKFSKQHSVDLPSSNLNVSRKFGSIEGISRRKEPTLTLQRSHTNLEKRPTAPDRGKKLNNIREIDDRKANIKSGSIWKSIGNVGSKDHLQRKSSNDSDKSLKDSNSGRAGYNVGRKPSLESLKRKTSKDSSSSSSKDEQILISSLTRDRLLSRKSSLEQEAAGGLKHHTAIQRVKRAEIVAAVTERLYSSRRHTEETSMGTNNASGTRSPPEGTDVKLPCSSGFAARSRLQEISRKMLLKRRRISVETQTEGASTLRFKDTASLTDAPKIVLQDAEVLTDEHADCDTLVADHRLPVLRVKNIATLTDRPRIDILRCKDAESLANDLDFDDYELHSPRNDSGILSDDTQNYAESNLSSAEVSELYPEGDRKAPCTDNSTNTLFSSPGRNSAVQTMMRRTGKQKDTGCSRCCLVHEPNQRVPASSPERNIISISLPDMISITIESTNGLESRIAVMENNDPAEEKLKTISNDKQSQTDEHARTDVEGSFLNDLSVRSTAIQADGRVFRIENIFQDPRSKSCSDAISDLRTTTMMKKSVTFRSSLGTSSVIETKENGTEIDEDRVHVQDPCQRKRSLLEGSLTRTFIARKRNCSLSPRRPAHKLVHRDLWKNWTLPCPGRSLGPVDYNRNIASTPSTVQQDVNLGSVDDLPSFTISESTVADKISEKTPLELSDTIANLKDSEKLKSISTKVLPYHDHNFSDDSLDYDEDNIVRKTTDAKIMDSHDHENYENFCPPDVVAHTKKEALKSASHVNSANVASSANDDFEDTEVEFPKRKPTEVLDKNPIYDYKSLILGTNVAHSESEEETNVKTAGAFDSISRKKVSFSNPNSPEEINDIVVNHKILAPKRNSEVALKSIIKKIKEENSDTVEILDIVRVNVEADQSLQQRKTETKSEEVLPASKENQNFGDPEDSLDNENTVFSNEDYVEESSSESDSVIEDEDAGSRAVSKRNIVEEYLSEAMTFMRNMNSINECMSATKMLEHYGKNRRKRGARQGNKLSTNKDYIKFRGRKVSLMDDTDKYLRSDKEEVVPVEFYEKCLKGIERLETCIDKVSKHNQILQDRYGIDVESVGAKLNLASPSVDSNVSAVTKSNETRQYGNVKPEDGVNESNPSRSSLLLLSSTQTDVKKRSTSSEIDKHETVTKFDKYDSNNQNNKIISDDDLERRIFDQLMDAADFSIYWNLRKSRQRRSWKMSDLTSQSPTTYSKLRETSRQDARGILNFDEVHATEDYPDDIRGIGSSPKDFRRTRLSKPTGVSRITTESELDLGKFCDCNKLPIENSNLLEIKVSKEPTILEQKVEYLDCLIDPANSIGTRQHEENEIARKNIGSKDSLRIDSMNYRFGGPLSMEFKYPGSPRAKFLELLKERRRIVENSRGTNAF